MNQEDRNAIVKYRIEKSIQTFNEIEILVKAELWNTAVNRLYYACYYSVIALLIKNNIDTQTHAGVRQMFGLHFIKTEIIDKDLGKYFSNIFNMRQTGDYDDFFDYTRDDVIELIEPAKQLINRIKELV